MKDYVVRRLEILREQIRTHFNLEEGTTEITVLQPVCGKIRVNSLVHDSNCNVKYLENLPMEIETIPFEEYEFVKWKGGKLPKSNKGKVLPIKAKKFEWYLEKLRIDSPNVLTNCST